MRIIIGRLFFRSSAVNPKSVPFNRESVDDDEGVDDELDMLEQELNSGDSTSDEDPVLDEDQDNIAADVVASDSEAINGVIEEDERDTFRLDELSAAETNLGRLSIAKVGLIDVLLLRLFKSYVIFSFKLWLTRLSIAPSSRKTSSDAAKQPKSNRNS